MDLLRAISEVIDTRSFSNIWYWIVLAAVWSVTSHVVLGVPSDLIARAQRGDGQAQADLEDLCRIKVLRLCSVGPVAGAIWVALISALLSALLVIGFVYRIDFAQALFLLLFPLSIVGLLSVLTAQRMLRENPGGAELCQQLARLRLYIQLISALALSITAVWGMSKNLYLSF